MGLLVPATVLILLTLIWTGLGDDDIADRIADRRPTGSDAIGRIRLVLSKTLSSVFFGGYLSIVFVQYVIKPWHILQAEWMSDNFRLGIILLSIAVANVLIGFLQNGVRLFQGRSMRNPINIKVFLRNVGLRRPSS